MASDKVTQLLFQLAGGDRAAMDELTPLVYRELKRIALGELHQQTEARRLYGEGLVITKNLADLPDATPDDFESYAEGLMDAPVKELLNPAAAVAYARRAVEMTKGEAWFFLDRLAVAYSKAGDYANAVAFEEKALNLMGASTDRTEIQERLARFQAARKKPRP